MTKPTAMFHLYTYDGDSIRPLDTRVFIGTQDEALDELKEEFKEYFPEDYDRKDRAFWAKRWAELVLSVDKKSSVSGRDPATGRYRRYSIERTSHLTEEADG